VTLGENKGTYKGEYKEEKKEGVWHLNSV